MPPQTNGIPMVNGLPSGGQQTDMNHLWSVVQQLSQMLEDNRAQTLGIVNGVQAIQARAAEEGGVGIREVNGEINCMFMCFVSLGYGSRSLGDNGSERVDYRLTIP